MNRCWTVNYFSTPRMTTHSRMIRSQLYYVLEIRFYSPGERSINNVNEWTGSNSKKGSSHRHPYVSLWMKEYCWMDRSMDCADQTQFLIILRRGTRSPFSSSMKMRKNWHTITTKQFILSTRQIFTVSRLWNLLMNSPLNVAQTEMTTLYLSQLWALVSTDRE